MQILMFSFMLGKDNAQTFGLFVPAKDSLKTLGGQVTAKWVSWDIVMLCMNRQETEMFCNEAEHVISEIHWKG